jgi:hypothetical protein
MFNSFVQSQIINMIVPMVVSSLKSPEIQNKIVEKIKEKDIQNILLAVNITKTLVGNYITNNPEKIPAQYLLVMRSLSDWEK